MQATGNNKQATTTLQVLCAALRDLCSTTGTSAAPPSVNVRLCLFLEHAGQGLAKEARQRFGVPPTQRLTLPEWAKLVEAVFLGTPLALPHNTTTQATAAPVAADSAPQPDIDAAARAQLLRLLFEAVDLGDTGRVSAVHLVDFVVDEATVQPLQLQLQLQPGLAHVPLSLGSHLCRALALPDHGQELLLGLRAAAAAAASDATQASVPLDAWSAVAEDLYRRRRLLRPSPTSRRQQQQPKSRHSDSQLRRLFSGHPLQGGTFHRTFARVGMEETRRQILDVLFHSVDRDNR